MSSTQQTSFNIDNAKSCLTQLEKLSEVLKTDWTVVHSQWSNLKICWHDRQYQKFQPIYEKLNATHTTNLKKLEKHILTLKEQINIAEEQASQLRALG